MSHAIPFDTLAFVKELESAGISAKQAEAQARALATILQQTEEAWQQRETARLEELATKHDLKHGLAETKVEIIKWVAGMFVAQSAIILGAMVVLFRMFLTR